MPLSASDKLGPYEILSPIGAGGMGEVYKARDTRLDRMVAIKTARENFSDRFQREAKAIAALNHSHICILYDVGPNYLVMEYVEGQPLCGPLPFDKVAEYGAQIASALVAAHAKNIIHRDLKPANILITSSGVKLLDFGLAKFTATLPADGATLTNGVTQAGAVVGTFAYMSPEQAEGRDVDARSDIFSFGVVLYEALTGQRAFCGHSAVEVLTALMRNEPTPVRELRPDSPHTLQSIIAQCMRKQPADRFSNSAELHSTLRGVQSSSPAFQARPSLAVLPFANLSADPENEYFSDGLAEEIINTLVQNPGLKVIARTSGFAFKGQNIDVRTIADKLGVEHILEGSVRRAGNRIRVTAQLITARDGSHLWSQRYDRDLLDIFAVQDEVSQAIAEALQGELLATAAPRRKYTPNLQAYESVLQAWHYHWKFTPEGIERGRASYERAIELDPGYALAYSGYAHHFLSQAVFQLQSAHEAMPQMRKLALRATELDPALAEAQAMLGIVAALYDYDWQEAERLFRLALACDPVPPLVRCWPGWWMLQCIGRAQESIPDQERAIREDPLNFLLRFTLGNILIVARNFAEGDRQLRQSIDLAETNFFPRYVLALSLTAQGRVAEALTSSEAAYSLAPWSAIGMGALAGVAGLAGDNARSEALLRQLVDKDGYDTPLGLTIAHLVRRDVGQAAKWAERAIDGRAPIIPWLLQHPVSDSLRKSDHWPALAKSLNLPPVH